MVTGTKRVITLWGGERMLGTNPISIAFPGKEEPAIVIDMATSAAAFGKIEMARRSGDAIPSGWGIDSEGRGTTDPGCMLAGRALFPLRSDPEHRRHKGYALGIMGDMLI